MEGLGERTLREGSAGAGGDGGVEELDLTGAGGNEGMDGEGHTGGEVLAVRHGDHERVRDLEE